ncbi:MAG: hypothetical protein KTR15_05810 [Phycisphaeraceae bacterium]|nr:hypothetical protein [Phycisphaeraceae bacterium]
MKPPKTEPYQRSRHRAALHAWVVAATTVASIGMSAGASPFDDNTHELTQQDDQALSQDASSIAAYWIDALHAADVETALSMMRLPGAPEHQQAVRTDLAVMSGLLAQQGVRVEPIAHRRAGHWALSAWRMDQPDFSLAPVIEPVTLYNPSSDGLFDRSALWQVVPQGVEDDPALMPLYNADYSALQDWYQTLL